MESHAGFDRVYNSTHKQTDRPPFRFALFFQNLVAQIYNAQNHGARKGQRTNSKQGISTCASDCNVTLHGLRRPPVAIAWHVEAVDAGRSCLQFTLEAVLVFHGVVFIDAAGCERRLR